MGFAGELATIGLAEVFQNIAFNRLTGTLSLSEGNRSAYVHFEGGVVKMVSHGPTQPFDYPSILAKSQSVDEETLTAALKKKRRRTLKAALRETVDLDEEAYDSIIACHVQEEVLLLFGWAKASFTFEEGKPDESLFDREQRSCKIALDPQAVAMEAARRLDEWESISRHLGSEKEIFLPGRSTVGMEFTPEEEEIFALADGVNDLGTVVDQVPESKFEVMKRVALLVEEGRLVRATALHLRDLAVKATATGEINRAIRHLEAALEREGGDLDIRRDLVKLYEKSGHKNEAAKEHKKIAFALTDLGDLDGALVSYQRATVLVPTDTGTLEKIVEIHESRGEREALLRAGRHLGEAYFAQGLYDDALKAYKKLTKVDEWNASLREALAEVYVKLSKPKKAAEEFLPLAERAYVKGNFNDALHHYRNVLRVDRGCSEAAERIDEIESGRIRLHRAARRRQTVAACGAVVLGLILWQSAREWFGHQALHEVAAASFGARPRSDADPARIQSVRHYALICSDYPLTLAAERAEDAARALLLHELQRLQVIVAADPRAAEEDIRALDKIPLPESAEELWADGRDRLLRKVAAEADD